MRDELAILYTNHKLTLWVERCVDAYLAAEAKTDPLAQLTRRQTDLVFVVFRFEEITLSRLAAEMGISLPSASVLVERLVEKELLTRETDKGDRRQLAIRIAPGAATLLTQVHAHIVAQFAELEAKLGHAVMADWKRALAAVHTALDSAPTSP